MDFRPKNFTLQELVPPTVFKAQGDAAWNLFDEQALRGLDRCRDHFGPITINNWATGGSYKESGLREKDTTTGAPNSAHKRGAAFDMKPKNCTVTEMHAYIVANQAQFPEIRRLEALASTPTWVHFDITPHDGAGIKVFNP